jgi:NADPH:quinone reductase-like Zn-dependent oxidoreductase
MLFTRANLKAGETAYVVGGGSGVGAAAIQLAKWKGARVLTSTTSPEKATKIKRLGATDVLVNTDGADAAAWVTDKTAGRGADVVVEHVGPATWEASMKALGRNGRLVTCGATTGPIVNLDLRGLFSKDQTILGARMGTEKDFQGLSKVIFSNAIHPAIEKTFPLDAIVEAHRFFEEKKHVGKILIDVR